MNFIEFHKLTKESDIGVKSRKKSKALSISLNEPASEAAAIPPKKASGLIAATPLRASGTRAPASDRAPGGKQLRLL